MEGLGFKQKAHRFFCHKGIVSPTFFSIKLQGSALFKPHTESMSQADSF